MPINPGWLCFHHAISHLPLWSSYGTDWQSAYAVTSPIPTCPHEHPSTAWCRQEDACPVLTMSNPSPLQSSCSMLGAFRRGCRQQQLSHLDLEKQQRAGSTQTTSAHCPVPPKPPLQLASRHAFLPWGHSRWHLSQRQSAIALYQQDC